MFNQILGFSFSLVSVFIWVARITYLAQWTISSWASHIHPIRGIVGAKANYFLRSSFISCIRASKKFIVVCM